jgi:hypothetical protein
MDAESYSAELLRILRTQSKQALDTLMAVDEILPDKVSGLFLGVHPNQDPDGGFNILVHLEGPDLYVLHKAIDAHRYLFQVKFVDGKQRPQVPMFDIFDTEFEVNDVIVDTALMWLQEIWSDFHGKMKELPTQVFGEDGYGTQTPKKLFA